MMMGVNTKESNGERSHGSICYGETMDEPDFWKQIGTSTGRVLIRCVDVVLKCYG